jgi:hypothetical protein
VKNGGMREKENKKVGAVQQAGRRAGGRHFMFGIKANIT